MRNINISKMISIIVVAAICFFGAKSAIETKAAATSPGDLIRASQPAVYYYASDGGRYCFPNEKIYFTWYGDFSAVKTVTDAELAAIPLKGNVTYKPGVKMIKIATDPKVYAVDSGGMLRWVNSEAVATALYGSDWNKKIDDVPDTFFINYAIGNPVNSTSEFSKETIILSAANISADKKLPGAGTLATPVPATPEVAINAPGKPALSAPSAVNISAAFVLNWTAAAGASDYTLQKSADETFGNPSIAYFGPLLAADDTIATGQYYRVRAENTAGKSEWSNVINVKVSASCNAPAAPAVNGPSNTINTGATFHIAWAAIADATAYSLERADNAAFINPTSAFTGNANDTDFSESLATAKTYFYRLKAGNGCGQSGWSNTFSVIIAAPQPATYNVPGDYLTIQAAINAAPSGQTVNIAAGIYHEHLILKDGVNLKGTGPAVTIIDGDNNGQPIYASALTATIEGLTAQNSSYYGIQLWNASHVTVKNCIIKDNPNGIGMSGGGNTIKNCLVLDNSQWGIADGSGSHNIINNTFYGNNTGYYSASYPVMQNNIIVGNTKGFDGTAAALKYNNIWNNTINYEHSSAGADDISVDPRFIDAAGNNFHLQGTSPCVDAGDPAADYSAEPSPNGGKANMGAYGNTGEAEIKVQPTSFNIPTDFSTIQAAINAAPSGQTVNIAAGTYHEHLTMKNGVNLKGAGPALTIIDGDHTGQPIYASGVTATIEGLTAQNSNSYGMQIWDSSQMTVINCIIKNNTRGIGLGAGGNSAIKNNLIINNSNWAIAVGSGTHQIINNTIYGNGTGYYGSGSTVLQNNIITNNTTGVSGAQVASLKYNNVWNNTTNYTASSAGANDISADPKFTNAAGGDYHLQALSPCIDAGDPASDYNAEPAPNGGKANMGAYGNTGEAEATLPTFNQTYSGPTYPPSGPSLQLTNLSVSGHNVRGGTLTVAYTLQNIGGTSVIFDSPGIFIGARDPSDTNKDFGYINPLTLAPLQLRTLSAQITVDKAGNWHFWPAYKYQGSWGPYQWHEIVVPIE